MYGNRMSMMCVCVCVRTTPRDARDRMTAACPVTAAFLRYAICDTAPTAAGNTTKRRFGLESIRWLAILYILGWRLRIVRPLSSKANVCVGFFS